MHTNTCEPVVFDLTCENILSDKFVSKKHVRFGIITNFKCFNNIILKVFSVADLMARSPLWNKNSFSMQHSNNFARLSLSFQHFCQSAIKKDFC